MNLKPVRDSEFEALFSTVKQGLYPYVDAVFGWDDNFQRARLKNDYKPSWFYWIIINNTRVGLLCFKPYENAYHVHLLLVFPDYQNQNIGSKVMRHIHQLTLTEQRSRVTLSSFKVNHKAISFYQKLGYQVCDDRDADFVSLSRELI